MKKKAVSFVFLIAIALLFASIPIVSAQTYSGFNRFTDDVKLFFSNGDSKVRLALEIREKEVNSALENAVNGNTENFIKNLEKAQDKLKIVQEKVSLNTSEEIKTSVDEITNRINKEENLSNEFGEYLLEEQKTQLTAVLTEKTFEYCKELAKEDFSLMLKEEECNPETAIPGLEKELKELKDIQIKLFVKLMLEIRNCIDDPRTYNHEANVGIQEKAKCEKMVALAIKCEYKEDEASCSELKAMEPKKGDSFAESFVPEFLMNLFREKSYMIGYDINHSDGVPEECWDNNTKPECKQYDYLKETNADWDEYGNFIGKRPENKEPTMQESIPQCFDENDAFLGEKCGKITVIRNEEGLVNYLIENEIDNIINEFENASEQHIIEINGSNGQMGGENWTIAEGQNEVQNKAWEVKQEINQINNQIVNITYAAGTGPGGEAGVVIEGDKQGVVTDNGGSGTGGLSPEVKTDVDSGEGSGDNGLSPEIKTDVSED